MCQTQLWSVCLCVCVLGPVPDIGDPGQLQRVASFRGVSQLLFFYTLNTLFSPQIFTRISRFLKDWAKLIWPGTTKWLELALVWFFFPMWSCVLLETSVSLTLFHPKSSCWLPQGGVAGRVPHIDMVHFMNWSGKADEHFKGWKGEIKSYSAAKHGCHK